MGMSTRLKKLEAAAAPYLKPCGGCGGIDWGTGAGVLGDAVVLSEGGGGYLCVCKWCTKGFRASLSFGPGRVAVSGAVGAEFPV